MIPVSNTTNANSLTGNVSQVKNMTQSQSERGRTRVLEQSAENQQLSQQSRQRLDIDAQAITAVEQERAARQQSAQPAEPLQTLVSSEQDNQQGTLVGQERNQQIHQQAQVVTVNNTASNTQFDQAPEQNQTAINTYQGVNNLARRESVQQLFGVDIFA